MAQNFAHYFGTTTLAICFSIQFIHLGVNYCSFGEKCAQKSEVVDLSLLHRD